MFSVEKSFAIVCSSNVPSFFCSNQFNPQLWAEPETMSIRPSPLTS